MHELLYSKSNTGKETNTSFSKGKQELIDLFFNLAVERDKMPAFMIHHDGIQEALCHLSVCDKTILEAYSLLCGSTRSSSLPMKCIEADTDGAIVQQFLLHTGNILPPESTHRMDRSRCS